MDRDRDLDLDRSWLFRDLSVGLDDQQWTDLVLCCGGGGGGSSPLRCHRWILSLVSPWLGRRYFTASSSTSAGEEDPLTLILDGCDFTEVKDFLTHVYQFIGKIGSRHMTRFKIDGSSFLFVDREPKRCHFSSSGIPVPSPRSGSPGLPGLGGGGGGGSSSSGSSP